MIVKSRSNKSKSGSSTLVKYILKPEKLVTKEKNNKPIVIKHNLRARTEKGYIREFEANEKLRLYPRSNNVKMYHEILSFSALDKEYINEKVLRDTAKQFIELRGINNLYLISAHFDREEKTIHLHAAIGGVNLLGRSVRISRSEYSQLKKDLDSWQRLHHPKLLNSLPKHGKKQELTKEAILKNIKNERSCYKEKLVLCLEGAYAKATSREHFISLIKAAGHEPYFRGNENRLQGIKYEGDKKFRLSPLGYDLKKIEQLDIAQKEITSIQILRKGKSKDIPKENTRLAQLEKTIDAAKELPPDANQEHQQEMEDIRDSADTGPDIDDSIDIGDDSQYDSKEQENDADGIEHGDSSDADLENDIIE